MMNAVIHKRLYTIAGFIKALDDFFDHLHDLRAASRAGRVDKAFSERIMPAVSQVNGCRYCSYAHTRTVLQVGVTKRDIQNLIAGNINELPQDELTALVYAQHYAETAGNPDPSAWQRVIDTYGEEKARDIMAYIRVITMGNLFGNTFDALLNRIKGRPASGSTIWQELGVLFGSVFIVPVIIIKRAITSITRSINEK